MNLKRKENLPIKRKKKTYILGLFFFKEKYNKI